MIQHKRHIAKAFSWRILGSIDTMVIAGVLTGNWKLGLTIGGVEVITKLILYYVHERVWYTWIQFGITKGANND
jgi:uncharacterized membrane protein